MGTITTSTLRQEMVWIISHFNQRFREKPSDYFIILQKQLNPTP